MSGQLDSSALPPAVRRIASALRTYGWVSFWVQIVLGIVSSLILIFAVYDQRANNLGTGAGLSLAGFGLVVLFAGAFWAFRYTRLARKLRSSIGNRRPKPKDVTQALQLGIIVNLVGLLITLLGAEAIIGSLIGKALAQPQSVGLLNPGSITNLIEPLDIFIVQAATHTVLAHYAGIVASLFLLRSVNRP